MQNRILQAALLYASHGWPVFPTKNKRPIYRGIGVYKATTDETTITKWFTEHPDAEISIPTGKATGLFIVDLDKKNNKDGFKTYKEKYGEIPDTKYQTTPHNGVHLLFKIPENLPETVKLRCSVEKILGTGIDTKGEGGQFVAAPSHGYKWCKNISQKPILPIPDIIIQKFKEENKPTTNLPVQIKRSNAYADKVITSLLCDMQSATEGARNNVFNNCAFRIGQMTARGILDESANQALINTALNLGLTTNEVTATFKSGFEAGLKKG